MPFETDIPNALPSHYSVAELRTQMHRHAHLIHVADSTWFIGTANNDDSTFTITDKVYDRAMPIELNERADAFECEVQPHEFYRLPS